MARPIAQGIDYFPLDVGFLRDIKVRKIIRACGISATPILIDLLGTIFRDEGYYMRWGEDEPFLIADEVGVSEGVVIETVKKAVQVDFFDANMFENHGILTSRGIQKRFFKAVERRKSICYDARFLLISVNDYKNAVNVYNNSINVDNNEQSKVKESKVKESKGKDSIDVEVVETPSKPKRKRFVKPTIDEIQQYCSERNNNVDPQRFYDYYESNGWKVGKNSMKDWKASVRTWERSNYNNQQKQGGKQEAIDVVNRLMKEYEQEEYTQSASTDTAGIHQRF